MPRVLLKIFRCISNEKHSKAGRRCRKESLGKCRVHDDLFMVRLVRRGKELNLSGFRVFPRAAMERALTFSWWLIGCSMVHY